MNPEVAPQRRVLPAAVALALSMLACYGTLIALAALSLAGITVVVNPAAVGFAVVGFAVVAVIATAAGIRLHRRMVPLSVTGAGALLLLYVHTARFSFAIEFAGFALLALGIWLDARFRRRRRATDGETGAFGGGQ